MRLSVVAMAAALVLTPLAVRAQEKSGGPPTYKVEFNIQDGRAGSSARHYTLLTDSNRKAVFKVGNRVPVSSGPSQYTYLDIGVGIECTVGEMNGRLEMHGNLDFSTIVPAEAGVRGTNSPNPTITQTKVDLDTAMEAGKPTVVASIDDPVTARKLQVEATIVRVN